MNMLRKHFLLALLAIGTALPLTAQAPANELGLGLEVATVYSRKTPASVVLAGFYRRQLAQRHWLNAAYRRVSDAPFDHEAGYGALDFHWATIGYAHRVTLWRFVDLEGLAGLELRGGREFFVDRRLFPPDLAATISIGSHPFFDLGAGGGLRLHVRLGHFFVSAEATGGTFFAENAHWFMRRQVGVGVRF